MFQQYNNQHVGTNIAAGQTSSIELRVLGSISEKRGHEGHECIWDGTQLRVGVEVPPGWQVGAPAQKTRLTRII